VSGRGDNTGVLSRQELLYLYSMEHRVPLHMGHVVAEYLRHQGQYARVGAIFSGPYITRLIMGMGLVETIRGAERTMVPAPLSLETLRQMGLIQRRGDSGYIIVIPPTQTVATEAPQAAPEAPPQEPAPEPQQETVPPVAPTPTAQADDRLERLEGAVRGIRTELAQIRGVFTHFRAEVRDRFDQLEQLLLTALTSPYIIRPRSPSPPSSPEPADAPDAAEHDTDSDTP